MACGMSRGGRDRWCHGGINPLGLFRAPSALHSGDDGEPVEVVLPVWSPCTGVRADCGSVVSRGRRCWRRALSRVQRWLRVTRNAGVWIELELPSAQVDGEL
jgi:hypothetical protein